MMETPLDGHTVMFEGKEFIFERQEKDVRGCEGCHFLAKSCPPLSCRGGVYKPLEKVEETMAGKEMVTLVSDYGKYKAGQAFVVVKANKDTTVCLSEKGKRIIFNNKHLSEKDEPVLELTKEQLEHIYNPMKSAFDVDEDIRDNDYVEEFTVNIQGDFPGMKPEVLKEDVVFIAKSIASGIKVMVKGGTVAGIATTVSVGTSMSEAERKVLEKLIDGDPAALKDSTLSVTSDTPELKEDLPPELTIDQCWLTDITKGRLPKSKINHVVNMYPEDHFPEDQRGYIPEVKDTHEWDPDVLETLILSHEMREKALITGLPGTGKSSSVEQWAAWIRQPYTRIGGRGDLETADLVGQLLVLVDVAEDGTHVTKQEFKPGILAYGLMNGHLVTIDEVMKIPSYIQMCMQHLYEKDGYLTVSDIPGTAEDKKILPIPEFLLILTDNVKGTGDGGGMFAATQIQDTSTLDRISLNETLDYLEPAREKAMLLKTHPAADKLVLTKLIKFANLVRNGYKSGEIALTLSPRGLLAILGMVDRGLPVNRAIELAFSNKIADGAEQIAIKDMLKTVGLVKL